MTWLDDSSIVDSNFENVKGERNTVAVVYVLHNWYSDTYYSYKESCIVFHYFVSHD